MDTRQSWIQLDTFGYSCIQLDTVLTLDTVAYSESAALDSVTLLPQAIAPQGEYPRYVYTDIKLNTNALPHDQSQ